METDERRKVRMDERSIENTEGMDRRMEKGKMEGRTDWKRDERRKMEGGQKNRRRNSVGQLRSKEFFNHLPSKTRDANMKF